ncbi:MAG: aromatic amino acid lyase, partial [Thermoplasmata archaeon]
MLPAGGTKNRDDEIVLDGRSLTIESTVEVARFKRKVSISPEAMNNVDRARQLVEDAIAAGRTIYGINTGFGDMCRTKISHENIKHLQENLLLSHAVGVGDPFPEEIVRGILLLRANALLRGNSGCRPVVIQKLVDMLNKNVVPVIPCKGSVGASGDLAPLAHASLVLIGRGEAFFDGVRMPGADALKKAGIEPLILDAKEGLALISGTQAMLSAASLALNDAFSLYYHALLAVAMAHEALLGTMSSMDAEIHHARNQKGQIEAAKGIREICKGSEIIDSHKNCSRVQDAYSLRCSPQVLGASLDAFNYVKE